MSSKMSSARGNIFLGVFAAVTLLALLGVGLNQFIRGPLTTSTNVTRVNFAQQQMNVAAQLIIGTSATQTAGAGNGDCDSDNFIEPLEYRDPSTNPHPTGGGYIPTSVGATKIDPWGTEYGYCVWDAGATVTSDNNATCGGSSALRLDGAEPSVAHPTKPNTQAIIALVSAGKDKTFNTTCNAFVDANDDAVADTAQVVKTSGTDDIILEFTYSEAQAAGGDLWVLKSGDPSIATISKDVEIASDQTLQFADNARLLLPTDVELTDGECTGAAGTNVNDGALRLNTTTSPPTLEVCYDSDPAGTFAWDWGSVAGGGGAASIDDLSDGIADYATLYNVFLGDSTGTATTTGGYNTALGYNALNTNIAKSGSTAIGYEAMSYADSGVAAITYNTAVGYKALRGSMTPANNTGTGNTAVGHSALLSTTSGSSNTANGTYSLYSNTSGSANVAIGNETLITNTIGSFNTGVGTGSLYLNTSGVYNTALGRRALYSNTIGETNVAIGNDALYSNVAGNGSTVVGYQAMYYANNTSSATTTYNTAVGYQALMGGVTPASNTGTSNTVVGHSALRSNTTGAENIAIGAQTASANAPLYANTTGSLNVAIGQGALAGNVAASQSTAVGYRAMYYANSTATLTNTANTAVGYKALMGSTTASANTGTSNTAIGHNALLVNTSGGSNVAVGVSTLTANTTGRYNTALGNSAMASNTEGEYNVAVGRSALYRNVAGAQNVAVGYGAMFYANSTAMPTETYNTAIGYEALRGSITPASNTGTSNTAIGNRALWANTSGAENVAIGAITFTTPAALYNNTTGSSNVAIGQAALGMNQAGNQSTAVGYQAMYYANSTTTSTTTYNTALGYQALRGSTTHSANTGTSNTAIGHSALLANTSGGSNTALGYNAGNAGTANTTGSNNTFIGYQAQANAATYTNGTALGNGAVLTASNRIVLGNTSIADIYAQVTTITGISDARRKKDITDLDADLGLDFIRHLRPVSYRYNNGDKTLRYGFIAQETEKALPERLHSLVQKNSGGLALIAREENKDRTYHMAYGELTAPIVKAIQEQQEQIAALEARVSAGGVHEIQTPDPEDDDRIIGMLAGAAFIFAMGMVGGAALTRRRG